MTPSDKSKSLNLKDSEKFLNFAFAYSFLGMLFLFCGCLSIWLVTLMFQNVMSDDAPVAETVERTAPACDDGRIEALQVAVATCIGISFGEMEAACIETAQRAICSTPEPVVIEASIDARDRRSPTATRRQQDVYIREMVRRGYPAEYIRRSIERDDEMYGTTPFFTPAKR